MNQVFLELPLFTYIRTTAAATVHNVGILFYVNFFIGLFQMHSDTRFLIHGLLLISFSSLEATENSYKIELSLRFL